LPWVLASICAVASIACSKPPKSDRSIEGAVALTIPRSNVVINSVHYTITGNGTDVSGDISVPMPDDPVTALVSGLPAGAYTVTLSAASADGRTTCQGSDPVTVFERMTTPVTVLLLCRTRNDSGTVAISGSFQLCPDIDSAIATPSVSQVGAYDVLDVVASASQPEGHPLTYAWSATSGTFAEPSAAQTVFRCAAPGPVTLTLTVSDGNCPVHVSGTFDCQPFCATRTNGTRCDDANACTRTDTCLNNQCVGANAVVCVASDQCHLTGACDPASGVCSDPAAPDGTACQLPMSIAACAGGACDITSCLPDFGNCDASQADGCETSLTTSASCGACGHVCAGGTSCESGRCLSPPPAGLVATPGGWTIALAWNASAGATGYEVRRAASPAGPFQILGQTAGTAFLDSAVVSGVPYYYAIAAINPEGTGAPSAPLATMARSKQICSESTAQHAVFAYDATQSGAAAPVRTIGGTIDALDFPATIASSLSASELYVMHRGGAIDVFPLGANGALAPLRTLAGAVLPNAPGAFLLGLDVDEGTRIVHAAGYIPAGRLLALDAQTGALTRTVSGPTTQLGNAPAVVFDGGHGELLVANVAGSSFSRVLTFDAAGAGGDVAPKRVLGAAGNATVGGFAIAYDRTRDQILTSCNCNNQITVFPRTATGDAAPARVLTLSSGVSGIYALLADDAADTIWAVISVGASSVVELVELPRGADGAVTWLHAPIRLPGRGHLARCN
jgi:hypothetical protein